MKSTCATNSGPRANMPSFTLQVHYAVWHTYTRAELHREIGSMENVALNQQGYPKLIDMGCAKKFSGKTSTQCGTPGYCAPEIVRGKEYDHTVDPWSIGIFIFVLMTGRMPFEGSSPMETLNNVLGCISPHLRRSSLSFHCQDMVSKCCCDRLEILQLKKPGWCGKCLWSEFERRAMAPPFIPACHWL